MLHNDIPSHGEIAALAEVEGPTCITIVTPTEDAPQDYDKARIAFKDQVRSALASVEDPAERKQFEAEYAELDDDDDFWRFQSRSLVTYATPDRLVTFRLPNRLQALETVSDRFHLKPLLRSVTFPQTAFVLALAEGSVRLIEIAADQPADEVRVQGMPKNAADHAGKSSINSRTEAGRLSGSDSRKLRVNQYARAVDHEVRGVLAGRDVPLILAAAEPIASVYRSVNSYRHLVDKTVEGNPEALSTQEVADGSRPALDDFHAEQLAAVRDTFNVRTEQGRTQTDVADVATAATYGQVDTVSSTSIPSYPEVSIPRRALSRPVSRPTEAPTGSSTRSLVVRS